MSTDIFSTFLVLGSAFLFWFQDDDKPIVNHADEIVFETYPSVDVFITTVTESLDILVRTIYGAMAIDYPNKVIYVLDDGNRPEVAELAKSLGVEYITREDKRGFKAGNFNNALKQTSSEFVMQLDADDVPASSILKLAVDKFNRDEKLAMVQFAQHGFNPGLCERTLGYPGLNTYLTSLNYVHLKGMASWGLAMWIGSGAILRRTALEKVGGVSTDCVIEDFHTTFLLFNEGLKTDFDCLAQVLVMNPETFSGMLTQYKRWFLGSVQVYFATPLLRLKNLTVPQRILQYHIMLSFWSFVPRTIWLCCPIIYFGFHIIPVRMSAGDFLIIFLPVLFFSIWGNLSVARKNSSLVILDIIDIAKIPALVYCVLTILVKGIEQPFQVTPKGKTKLSYRERYWCVPYLLLIIFISGAVIKWTLLYIEHPDLSIVMLFFAWYMIILLSCVVCMTLEKPQPVSMHTVPCNLAATLVQDGEDVIGRLFRVSASGGSISSTAAWPVSIDRQYDLQISDGQKTIQKRVHMISQNTNADGLYHIDLSFVPVNEPVSSRLAFVKMTVCDNKEWQYRPNEHTRSALPYALFTPWKKLSKWLDKAFTYEPSRFSSKSISSE